MRNFKKLLSVILAVMMVMSVIPAGATTGATGGTFPIIPEGATLIFAEDFESDDYTVDSEILSTTEGVTINKDGKNAFTFSKGAAGISAKVVNAASDGFSGNALKITNTTTTSLTFTVFLNGGDQIDFTSETIGGEANPFYGKQLVYEFDVKKAGGKESSFMKIDSSVSSTIPGGGSITPFQKSTGTNWAIRNGPWETRDEIVRPWYLTQNLDMTNKTSFKVVFDQTGNVDVVRTYRNGELGFINKSNANATGQSQNWNGKIVKDFVGEYFRGDATANMSAPSKLTSSLVKTNDTSANVSVTIDNIVVYAVDSINFEGFEASTDVNPDEGLEVKFDQPFNATVDTFKVTDMAGTDVENAITSVTMSADKKTANVKMDFGVLAPLTSYKLWIDDEFTSAAGALFYTNPLGITAADEWIELGSFETCDKLDVVVSPASGAITGYDLGDAQEVTLTFSSALADTVDIANAFTVTDELENPVTGLGISLNAERTVATLDLSTLSLGEGVHTIKSVDNAVYNNSNVKASITYTFDTVDFNAAATPVTVAQYVAGSETDNIITVTLGAATTLTNDNIITGFEVTDLAGNPVNGLAATLDGTGKVVTLDIKDIEFTPGKYFIKSTDYLVDRRGRTLIDPVNVAVKCVTELSDATLIIEDDFEVDYAVGENWLTGAGATLNVNAADGGKWEITGANSHQAGFMGVVDGTTLTDDAGALLGFDSNVLKITTASTSTLSFWRKAVSDAIDVAGQNKMLIYEYDVYGSIPGDKKFMAISTSNNYGFQRSPSQYHVSTGPWPSGTDLEIKKNWFARTSFDLDDKKLHILQIVDQTKAVDSIRTYVDGEIKKANYSSVDNTYSNYGKTAYDFYGENYKGEATWNYGDFKGIYSAFGGAGTMYIDNLKVYLVDAIAFEDIDWGETSSDAFNPDTGLTLNFTQKIRAEELKNNLIIKNAAGEQVLNAVKSVELSADEKSAKVKFDFSKLEKFANYSLELNFLFRSKDGAYIARDGVVDGGNVLLTSFTTGDKLETTVSPASITGYDKGVDKTVTITLSSPLKADITDIAGLFLVKDGDGNEISGLAAAISDDRMTITLQLSGLALGDGTHIIETKEGALVNDAGVVGSVVVNVNTMAFTAISTPSEGGIVNYTEGTDQMLQLILTLPTAMDEEDAADAFVVVDEAGNNISGLTTTLAEDKKSITLNLSGLTLGIGEHTIKSTSVVTDSRGRELGFEYKFTILPFYAEYMADVTEYVPGTEQAIDITVTYPLSDASASAAANAFTVKNKYGSNVSGLDVTVSEDKKTISLNLAALDIEGGNYVIKSIPGAFVNAKGEVLADIVVNLSTSAAAAGDVAGDTGVGPNSGSEIEGDFTSGALLLEDFDNEGYARDVNWLAGGGAFVPANFDLQIVGNGDKFVDAEVKIVKDPTDPNGDNYVLKNVGGFRDNTGTVIAGSSNYHRIKRNIDGGGTATIPVNDYTVVKLSTKVYIPAGGSAGIPTGDSGSVGNTKDTARIIALTGSGTTPISHANLRKNSSGTAQYNTWVNASDSASGSAGTVSASLSAETWHTIELIFGNNVKSDGVTKFKSYEVWVDGKKITSVGGYYAADYGTVGGMMSVLASATGGTGPTTVYYDDWSIVKANKLATHINVAKEDVPEDQVIKLQMTGRLVDESAALIEANNLVTLKDAEGNDVDATITFDNSGVNTKIVIDPTYGLKYQTQYTVNIAENYVDDKGKVTPFVDELNNVFGGFNYTFETAKALNNTIDIENGVLSYDANFMHEETEFNYTMVLSEAASRDIIAAVATFSEDNELLGIDYKTISTGETGADFTVVSELGTKYLRLYIWEAKAGGSMGRLMQIPDEVTSR